MKRFIQMGDISMVFFFYLVLNLVAIYFFIKYKWKMLHALEILAYWIMAVIIFLNYTGYLFSNTKYLTIPDKVSIGLTHLINRTVLTPVIVLVFLNIYLMIKKGWGKILLVIGFTILFTGLEFLSDMLGVLEHHHWKIWWSISFWFTALLLWIGFMVFFRRLLYKRRSFK